MLRALVFMGLCGCASLPTPKVASGEVSRTLLVNGAPLTITLNEPSLNSAAVDRLFKQLQREAVRIDATFFATGSLELINNELAKSKGPIRISPHTGQMIADAMRGYQLTGGVFDPTVGPLIRAWIAMKGEQPSPEAIGEAMNKTGADKLILSSDLKSLSTQVVGMRLEPGGLRDGWVVKRISEMLSERRLINFFVNFRGACWYASGLAADGRPWRVLINDHHTRRAGLVYLENESLSISASLVPRPDGKSGSKGHIVDPRNGFLVQESRSVAAIAPSPLDAEILSTATVVLGSQSGDAVGRVEGSSVIIFYGESKNPLMLGVSPKFERVKGLDHGTYFEGERASR